MTKKEIELAIHLLKFFSPLTSGRLGDFLRFYLRETKND